MFNEVARFNHRRLYIQVNFQGSLNKLLKELTLIKNRKLTTSDPNRMISYNIYINVIKDEM